MAQTTMLRRCVSTAVLAGGALLSAAPAIAQFEDRPPTPPRYEAVVLPVIEVPSPYNQPTIWTPWCMADDGTVYGYAEETGSNAKQMFRARAGEPTVWLWKREPLLPEWRPERANNAGYVLITDHSNLGSAQNYVYDPSRGEVVDAFHFHPTGWRFEDLNNSNVVVGELDILKPFDPYRAMTFDLQRRRVRAVPQTGTFGLEINDPGSVLYFLGGEAGRSRYVVKHAPAHGGGESIFDVFSESLIGVSGMNNRDEAVGINMRLDDLERARQGGWFWSKATGWMNIPFWHTDDNNLSDVFIYGISDDGWVFGREKFESEDGSIEYPGNFLWRPDAGFFDVGDLYEWEGVFYGPGAFGGLGAIASANQIAFQNVVLGQPGFYHCVFLMPTPTPMLRVAPDPLRGGQPATFDVTDGEPSQTTGLYYSLTGKGETYVPELDLTLELANAQRIGDLQTTDPDGATSWNAPVPNVPGRRDVWFQVAQKESCRLSVPIQRAVVP